jgi:hypothetical protein
VTPSKQTETKRRETQYDDEEEETKKFDATQYSRPGLSHEEIEELKEAFDLFDTDGSGESCVSIALACDVRLASGGRVFELRLWKRCNGFFPVLRHN